MERLAIDHSPLVYYGTPDPSGRYPIRIHAAVSSQEKTRGDRAVATRLVVEPLDGSARREVRSVGIAHGKAPFWLFAELPLLPGEYRLRFPEQSSKGWRFSLARTPHSPVRLFCEHRTSSPSYRDRLVGYTPKGEILALSALMRIGLCCREEYLRQAAGVPNIRALALYLPQSPSWKDRIGGHAVSARPGEYLLVDPELSAVSIPDQRFPIQARVVMLMAPLLEAFLDQVGGLRRFGFEPVVRQASPLLLAAVGQLEDALRRSDAFGGHLGVQAAAQNLLFHLVREHPNRLRKAWTARQSKPVTDPRVLLAARYIRLHFAEPCPVAEIARAASVSPPLLWKLFKRHMEQTPNDYLQAVRVEEAKRLLKDPRMPLEEVALAVGYQDARSFRRVFQTHAHKPVRAFRRR